MLFTPALLAACIMKTKNLIKTQQGKKKGHLQNFSFIFFADAFRISMCFTN